MKRSEINQIIVEAKAFLAEHQFHLPPWAYWSLSDWKKNKEAAAEVMSNMLGWDITDFGSGDFWKRGLFLFTLRNGNPRRDKKPTLKNYDRRGGSRKPPPIFIELKWKILIDSEDQPKIRSSKVDKLVSKVSAIPVVRQFLIEKQRKISANENVVNGRATI